MIALLWIGLLIFLAISFFSISCLIFEMWRVTSKDGVPSLSSTWGIIDEIICKQVLPRDGLILDLGAGNGWTMRRLWRRGIHGPLVGYEKEFVPWGVGAIWNKLTGTPVKLLRQDFSAAPYEEAKGIYLFLMPQTLEKLAPIIRQRCRSGTVVVSAEFSIPGWNPTRVLEARGVTSRKAKIFCYSV